MERGGEGTLGFRRTGCAPERGEGDVGGFGV